MDRTTKERLAELENDFLMYKRQMNILSGLSNGNLILLNSLIKSYGVMVVNKELENILRRTRWHFEKCYEKEWAKILLTDNKKMSKNNRGGLKTKIRKAILEYLNLELTSEQKKDLDIIIQKKLSNN